MLDPTVLAPERVRGLRRREYEELVELGVFGDERLELLRGVLVEMSPQGVPHARITGWLAQRLSVSLDFARYDVRSHSPYAATSDSMPEPDVSVSRRSATTGHPNAALLLVEVAETSLAKDRKIKTEIYAEAGVPDRQCALADRRGPHAPRADGISTHRDPRHRRRPPPREAPRSQAVRCRHSVDRAQALGPNAPLITARQSRRRPCRSYRSRSTGSSRRATAVVGPGNA